MRLRSMTKPATEARLGARGAAPGHGGARHAHRGRSPRALALVAGVAFGWLLATGGALAQATAADPDAAAPKGTPPDLAIRIEAPSMVLAAPASETGLELVISGRGGLPANTFLRIQGLSPKMALSDGHAIAPGAWAVPLAAIERLKVIVPTGHAGKSDVRITLVTIDGGILAEAGLALVVTAATLVERSRPARPQEAPLAPPPGAPPAALAAGAVTSSAPPPLSPPPATAPAAEAGPAPVPPAAASSRVAALPPSMPKSDPSPAVAAPASPPSAEAKARAEGFLSRGRALLNDGNIVLARLFFQRAADAGLAEGALAMGETFDAAELRRRGAIGVQPSPDEARRWYERARELGAGEAALGRLERLGRR
jgi:hypothetical protein